MNLLILSLLILVVLIVFLGLALMCAVYIKTLNWNLTQLLILMEIRSLKDWRIKAIVFKILLEDQIKTELQMITKMTLSEFINNYGRDTNLKYEDIVIYKRQAVRLLKKAEKNELLSLKEVKELLTDEGLYSFMNSISRGVYRYSSFEQKEKMIGDKGIHDTLQSLYKRKTVDTINGYNFFSSFNKELIERLAKSFVKESLAV